MNLSVALCTYNGERYLPAQLASILNQSRLPDEVVICDDASTDRTAGIIEDFARQAPFPVRMEVNAANMGTTPNFARAIGMCKGDAIVLADQDDVWFLGKLAAVETALTFNPEAGFVFSDADVVDESLNALGYTLWDAIGFDTEEQEQFRKGKAFEALLRRYRVTGATMAFRSAYRKHILPIPPAWLHDAWIALVISSIAPCSLISEPLIRYRQHGLQQCGGRKRGLFEQYRSAQTRNRETFENVAQCYLAARERLNLVPGVKAERIALLDRKVEHCRHRMMMRNQSRWRIPFVLREIWTGNYQRFSLGWKAMAQDLFLR
jgi:glycosyltransferase involved in cell wall biosynthesis